jgi:hypothetical protein
MILHFLDCTDSKKDYIDFLYVHSFLYQCNHFIICVIRD